MKRPCIDCGEPTPGTRCTSCAPADARRTERARTRPGPRRIGYTSAWDRLSKRARAAQPWCLDCGTDQDLTGDHRRWPARGLEDVDVVCRACNSRRGPARTLGGRGTTNSDGTGVLGKVPITHPLGSR